MMVGKKSFLFSLNYKYIYRPILGAIYLNSGKTNDLHRKTYTPYTESFPPSKEQLIRPADMLSLSVSVSDIQESSKTECLLEL